MSNGGWGDDVSDHHKAQVAALGKRVDLSTSVAALAEAGVPMALVVGQPAPTRSERSQPVGPVALDALCPADADPSVNPYREVRDALEARLAVGVERYGTALHTHNGRDALRDALEEALDGMQYAQQANLEARDEGAHDAALWAQDARQMFAAAALSLLRARLARARGGR